MQDSVSCQDLQSRHQSFVANQSVLSRFTIEASVICGKSKCPVKIYNRGISHLWQIKVSCQDLQSRHQSLVANQRL
uniref:Uncharacterized protein n=1 Tax=Globodera rostochiensis TaxID=31243 RepID=A0A914HR31_GLORO